MEQISAIVLLPDEYGRQGQPITAQTRAFVMVMRYTGMSIGDTAKLRKADVDRYTIRTYRKKTGEDVFAKVPPLVSELLDTAPHDSEILVGQDRESSTPEQANGGTGFSAFLSQPTCGWWKRKRGKGPAES